MRSSVLRTVLYSAAIILTTGLAAHDHAHLHGDAGLEFHANKGQWPAQVLYRCRTQAGAVFVERSAFTYLLASGGPEHGVKVGPGEERPFKAHAYRVHFEGGAPRMSVAWSPSAIT